MIKQAKVNVVNLVGFQQIYPDGNASRPEKKADFYTYLQLYCVLTFLLNKKKKNVVF